MREEDRSSAFADDLLSDELLNDPALVSESDLATEIFAVADAPPPPDTPFRRFRKRVGRSFMIVGCLLGLFVLLYTIDLMTSAA